MRDKLNLMDIKIPLNKRLEDFMLWSNSNASGIIDVIAEQLGVPPSVVDVFLELSNLDEEEINIIEQKRIDIDSLFLIVRANKTIRYEIYKNALSLINNPRPLSAIRDFIDRETEPDFNSLIQSISAKVWSSISKYLKERNITSGTITTSFRSMLVRAVQNKNSGKEISQPMVDWIVRAITHDHERGLNIFTNEIIQRKFPNDFNIIKNIIELINSSTQRNKNG